MKELKRGWSSPAFDNSIPGGDGLQHSYARGDKMGKDQY